MGSGGSAPPKVDQCPTISSFSAPLRRARPRLFRKCGRRPSHVYNSPAPPAALQASAAGGVLAGSRSEGHFEDAPAAAPPGRVVEADSQEAQLIAARLKGDRLVLQRDDCEKKLAVVSRVIAVGQCNMWGGRNVV